MVKLALVLYIAFLIVALGLRSWLQYRRTGDHGLRGLSRRDSPIEWLAAALVAVSFTALLAAPILTLAGLLECLKIPSWLSVFGVFIALTGFALAIVAQLHMGASWRVGVDSSECTDLVTGGLFALVRNPIFSGLGVFAIGYALLVPNACSVVALLLGLAGVELQVRYVEEPFLLRVHGDAYRSYARRVGRFVPFVGRLPER
jgi:protein-S-isoprenylcysteine O-methyltransferase Ste14